MDEAQLDQAYYTSKNHNNTIDPKCNSGKCWLMQFLLVLSVLSVILETVIMKMSLYSESLLWQS
jgi:hypothetical protein